MQSFKDKEGREWRIELTIWSARQVKQETGGEIDLVNADRNESLKLLSLDADLLCSVIWTLIAEQANAKNPPITDRDFWQSMTSESIEAAADALMGAVTDFFPPRRRATTQMILDKVRRANDAIHDHVDAALAEGGSLDRKMKEELEKLTREIDGSSSTNSPPSPALETPVEAG